MSTCSRDALHCIYARLTLRDALTAMRACRAWYAAATREPSRRLRVEPKHLLAAARSRLGRGRHVVAVRLVCKHDDAHRKQPRKVNEALQIASFWNTYARKFHHRACRIEAVDFDVALQLDWPAWLTHATLVMPFHARAHRVEAVMCRVTPNLQHLVICDYTRDHGDMPSLQSLACLRTFTLRTNGVTFEACLRILEVLPNSVHTVCQTDRSMPYDGWVFFEAFCCVAPAHVKHLQWSATHINMRFHTGEIIRNRQLALSFERVRADLAQRDDYIRLPETVRAVSLSSTADLSLLVQRLPRSGVTHLALAPRHTFHASSSTDSAKDDWDVVVQDVRGLVHLDITRALVDVTTLARLASIASLRCVVFRACQIDDDDVVDMSVYGAGRIAWERDTPETFDDLVERDA